MADYSHVIMGGLRSIGDAVVDNRRDARQNMEQDRSYARALGLDEYNKGQDALEWDWKRQEAARSQSNADRSFAQGMTTDDIREYQFAKKNGFQGGFNEWLSGPGGGGTEYGLTPFYAEDANGNVTPFQPSKAGGARPIELPDGYKVAAGVDKLDLGTRWGLVDKKSGNIIGYEPKDLAGAEYQKVTGEMEGKQSASAPADVQAADDALLLLKGIKEDPYLSRGTGFSSMFNVIPGTGGYDFQNKVEQAKSGGFLTAIEKMRGLGSLSNAEGQTATAAVNRMNTATSEEEFRAAAADYERVVSAGRARAAARMSRGGPRTGNESIPDQPGWSVIGNGVRIREIR